MLILTRKEGESLQLGEDITVTVVSVKGGHVRIGITAPREVAVHREEIYQKIVEGSAPEAASNTKTSTKTNTERHQPDAG